MLLHLVTQGSFVLEVGDEPPTVISQGDLVLLPHGIGHRMVDESGRDCTGLFDLPVEKISERYEVLRIDGDGDYCHAICAGVRFEHPNADHLLNVLPPLIHLASHEQPSHGWIKAILEMMAAEASALNPGGETVMTRLADVLVIHLIRSWIESVNGAESGWLAALKDQQIGNALIHVHREPDREWTVETMAQEAGMSRSAFAAKFTSLVGETAMKYVTRWRMNLARTRLILEDISMGELAEELGYRSEAAFARTFKRYMGITPGAARKLGSPGAMF
jgi:AraC-like DNA-binding protein